MCSYNILSRSQNGYVILCNQCNHYQVAFGTMAATFEPDAFKYFCDYVICMKDSVCCNGFENEKRIKVDVFSTSTMLILNYKELRQLYDIVCEAKFNLETDELLSELNLITE